MLHELKFSYMISLMIYVKILKYINNNRNKGINSHKIF